MVIKYFLIISKVTQRGKMATNNHYTIKKFLSCQQLKGDIKTAFNMPKQTSINQ